MTQVLSKNIFDMAKDEFLKREELLKIIRKYHRSKIESEKDSLRDIVVKNNMRLVIKMAKVYAARSNKNPDDLFQNGVIGIIVALDKFKPSKKTAFSTYAFYWINHFIRQSVNDDEMISTHRYVSVGAGKIPLYFKAVVDSSQDANKFIILLRKYGVSRKDQDHIERIISLNKDASFIDIYADAKEGERFIDIIEDKNATLPDVDVFDKINRERMEDCIRHELLPLEKVIIKELYFKGKRNVKALSKKIKKSQPYVESLERKAISKITRAISGKKSISRG